MRRIGHNDKCPCGSGKKYKFCCMEKDKQSNITRIVRTDGDTYSPNVLHDGSSTAPPDAIHWVNGLQHDEELPGEQDETFAAQTAPFDAKDVEIMVETLQWEDESYRVVARDVMEQMANDYEWDDIAAAILIWHAYSSIYLPSIRKIEAYSASVEYCIALINDFFEITQTGLAEKYGVSVTTISKRSNEMMELAEKIFGEALSQEFEE